MNEIYRRDLRQYEPLTQEEILELFEDWLSNENKDSYLKILKHNLRLVVHFANQYKDLTNDIITMDDLINEGNIGLIQAIQNYDHKKNIKFSFYASFWIKKHIILMLKKLDNNVYQSDSIELVDEFEEEDESVERLKKAIDKLKPKHQMIIKHYYGIDGYELLTSLELGTKLNLSRQRINQIINFITEKLKEMLK